MGIGSLVELVDNNWRNPHFYKYVQNKPIAGKIYTIRDIGTHVGTSGNVAILLEEIVNPKIQHITKGMMEPSFRAYRFRELLSPTSIDIEYYELKSI